MGRAAPAQDDDMNSPAGIRRRRTRLGLSQRELGAGPKSVSVITAAMSALEIKALEPPVEMVEVPKEDLRAVLDELRALRRRVEDVATRIEARP